jgi:hypothetical protein
MPCRTCLVNLVQSFLPPAARLLIKKKLYIIPAIFLKDVDKDNENEVVAFYSLEGERYTIVLKKEANSWYVLSNRKFKSRLEPQVRITNLYLAPVKAIDGMKYGYINSRGELEIKPQFDYAYDFQDNGLAVVSINNLNGLIDSKGNYILRPKYDTIPEFSEGRATVLDKLGFKIIDEGGRELTSKTYSFVGNYKNGRALFSNTDASGKYLYGYLDRQGKEVVPLKYEAASDFDNGRALVKVKDKQFVLIGINGEVLQSYNYYFVGNLGDGLLAFQKDENGKFGYVDLKGNIVIQPQYTWAMNFSNGRAVVNTTEDYNNKFGLIDRKGSFVIKPEYSQIDFLGEDRVAVGKAIEPEKPYMGSKYAVADINGNFLTDFIYNNVEKYNKRLASAADNKNTFFIDKSGKLVKTLPVVSGGGTLLTQGELIKAFVDNRTAYYDMAGKIVWQQNKVIPLSNQYKINELKFKPNMDYLVYYPQIEGMKNRRAQQNTNNKLKVLSQIKNVPANVQLEASYTGDFSVEFFKKNLLVLELDAYDFPFGAAHGMPSRVYPHIDLVSGSFYDLKDLFKPNSNYVKVLSDIIGNQIKTDAQYNYVFPDTYKGIKPDQPFYVDENNLYIYFTPYEIAPYAAGFPTFKISFKDITNIINTQGEFWKAFN